EKHVRGGCRQPTSRWLDDREDTERLKPTWFQICKELAGAVASENTGRDDRTGGCDERRYAQGPMEPDERQSPGEVGTIDKRRSGRRSRSGRTTRRSYPGAVRLRARGGGTTSQRLFERVQPANADSISARSAGIAGSRPPLHRTAVPIHRRAASCFLSKSSHSFRGLHHAP